MPRSAAPVRFTRQAGTAAPRKAVLTMRITAVGSIPPSGRGDRMSGPLIALTGVIYAYVAADQFWRGNPGMGIAYCGYAFANVGLYLLAR